MHIYDRDGFIKAERDRRHRREMRLTLSWIGLIALLVFVLCWVDLGRMP